MAASMIKLKDVAIDSEIGPGDLGGLIFLHGSIYGRECGFGIGFEMYVARGVVEFHERYDPDRVWFCRLGGDLVGSLVLMHREGGAAQLRYFLLRPDCRGIGLGKELMGRCMDFLRQRGYRSCYLWTTSDLTSAASLYQRNGFTLTEEKTASTFGLRLLEQRYDLVLPSAGNGGSDKGPVRS